MTRIKYYFGLFILFFGMNGWGQLLIKNSGGNEVLRLTQAGNVAIGTTNFNPDARLYVSGSSLTNLDYKIKNGPIMTAYTTLYSRDLGNPNNNHLALEGITSNLAADDGSSYHISVHGVVINSAKQQMSSGSLGYINCGQGAYCGVQGYIFPVSEYLSSLVTMAGNFVNERVGNNDYGVWIKGENPLYVEGGGTARFVNGASINSAIKGIITFGDDDEFNINRNTSTNRLYIAANTGHVEVRANATTGIINLVASQVQFNGVTQWSSDVRLKEEIQSIADGLEAVKKLRPVSYHRKQNPLSNKEVGLVAQEVEKVLPELVTEDADGYKYINYVGIIPVLIKAIQEQEERIRQLEQGRK